jgi:F-type H+-transporting ATPase subunit b
MEELLHSLGIVPLVVLSQTIGFIILVLLVRKYGLNPIYNMIDERRDEIKESYAQLESDRADMLKTRQEYETRLAGIESEARAQIAAAVKEAQELRTSILADAQKQAEATLEKSRIEADREREKAFLSMRAQIVDLTIQAAGKVITETLDAKKHSALVDEFIASASNGKVGNA